MCSALLCPPRYIQNPLLLEGKKFDVRSYLLIACTMPYMVFFGHGYARLTLNLYDPCSEDLSGHLTNQVRALPAALGRDHCSGTPRRVQLQTWLRPSGGPAPEVAWAAPACSWHCLPPSATAGRPGEVARSPAPTHHSSVPSECG